MTEGAILAVDAGTTGVRTLLLDRSGVAVGQGYRELTQYYPFPGWVEHDAGEIWRAAQASIADAMRSAPEHFPIALGIANQRETCLFWERDSGKPLHRAVVWQCRRSTGICDELKAGGLEPEIIEKTGLRLDPYFSGTKALWLTRHDASLRDRIAAGEVAFGTIDTWLAYKLSGGHVLVTDPTNGCRTLAYDINRHDWDDALLQTFGLSRKVMPSIVPTAGVVCRTRDADVLSDGVPIAALVGDQQAALYGQACCRPGLTKATYGTGCFLLSHTGDSAIRSAHGLLTTIAATGDGSNAYALEGSIFTAGAALQWCRDNLGLVAGAEEASRLAASVPDAGGTVFVPAISGLGSPYWAPDARGAIYGLTGATTKGHIVRAALDAMVFQAQDVLELIAGEIGGLEELRVDGGAAANDALMQLQADLAGVPVSRLRSVESTAMGAGYLAGLTTGFWSDETEIEALRDEERRFEPSAGVPAARRAYERWQRAVDGLLRTDLPRQV